MQKRAGVRGSRKKKLLSCVFLAFLIFGLYSIFSGDDDHFAKLREDRTIVQAVPEDIATTKAYSVQPIQCFSLDCRLKNNAKAYAKCTDADATAFNQEGVALMETLFADSEKIESQHILDGAEEKFLSAIKKNPTYHRAYANLALVKFAQGKEDKALDYINQAIEHKKNVADYYAIRAFFRENIPEDYAADIKSAELLDSQISKGRYFGILIANDTRVKQHRSFPLVRSLDSDLEKSFMAKYLLWLEFSPISFFEYAKITPEMTNFFIENRYLTIKQLLPNYIKEITKKCYMAFSERNLLVSGDLQTSHREVVYNDRCGRYLQFALTDTVRAITHTNVIPSYTYAGLYSPGATLGPHLDRPQCEFTLTLSHLQIPSDQPWAIQFGKKWSFEKDPSKTSSINEKMPPADEIETVSLLEGDGLLLMGRHLVHFRNQTLPEGHRTHNTFLHYVQDDWTSSLD